MSYRTFPAALMAAALVALPPAARAESPEDAASAAKPAPAATVRDGFTLAVVGDLLGAWKPKLALGDPGLAEVSKILTGADAAFANLEANMFDIESFTGYPAAENGGFEQGGVGSGPYFSTAAGRDLKAMGLDLISVANNHALDWSYEGLAETLKNLKDIGLTPAGAGRNRAVARNAAFFETPHGRVAFVATASTFLPMAPAGPGAGERNPRPGISALRNTSVTLVDQAEFDALKVIAERQGHKVKPGDRDLVIAPNDATFTGQAFRLSDHPGVTYDVNAEDRAEILAAIAAGKAKADLAVFSIHAHETLDGAQEYAVPPASLKPADFLQPLFRDAVDAGADAVITHGPHTVRGIEIYKGKPIFYGMGSLFLEVHMDWPIEWYDSLVAVNQYKGGKLAEIRLYPLTLARPGKGVARSQAGAPQAAHGADAKRILTALQDASKPYGTAIVIEKDIGVIRLP